jgi:hypothetical protein
MPKTQSPDRDVNYMKKMWGTVRLVTDYVPINNKKTTKYSLTYCEYFDN